MRCSDWSAYVFSADLVLSRIAGQRAAIVLRRVSRRLCGLRPDSLFAASRRLARAMVRLAEAQSHAASFRRAGSPLWRQFSAVGHPAAQWRSPPLASCLGNSRAKSRSEEHTSELQYLTRTY